jgi:hypothetical protein
LNPEAAKIVSERNKKVQVEFPSQPIIESTKPEITPNTDQILYNTEDLSLKANDNITTLESETQVESEQEPVNFRNYEQPNLDELNKVPEGTHNEEEPNFKEDIKISINKL